MNWNLLPWIERLKHGMNATNRVQILAEEAETSQLFLPQVLIQPTAQLQIKSLPDDKWKGKGWQPPLLGRCCEKLKVLTLQFSCGFEFVEQHQPLAFDFNHYRMLLTK